MGFLRRRGANPEGRAGAEERVEPVVIAAVIAEDERSAVADPEACGFLAGFWPGGEADLLARTGSLGDVHEEDLHGRPT